MILEIFLASSLIVPGLGVLRFLGIRTNSFFEQLILSYILSLTIMFVLLYIGGILMTFALTSIIFLVIVVLSYGYLIILYRTKLISLSFWRSLIPDTKSEKFLMFISLVSLVVIYSTILLTRPLLDSDVVQYYLPFSREIIASNGFTYATGYDYNIFLKPVGVSVLYAWTYIVSGSFMVETFRLLPIIPVILLALMTFEISREVSGTETIGVLSTIIFILLPLHDRFLYYNAFYPDVFYYPLVFFAIFGVIKYSKTSEKRYLFWTGLAFGIGGLIKAQTILFVIACLLCLVAIEIKSKKMVFLICLVTPLFILIPNLLAEIGHPNSIIASMGPERVALLLFASILCVVVYTILEPRYTARDSLKLSSDELEDTDDIIPLEEDENDGNFLSDLKSLVTRALIVL
ncbi:MAG: glycosyltransferase family 39 protein, partial [Candidatus Thorarchaeota archaeon]